MDTDSAVVHDHGRGVTVPGVSIDGRLVTCTPGWLRVASVFDDELLEGDTVRSPGDFVERLRNSGLRADLLTFAQKVPDVQPRHAYHLEWDSAAVVSIESYEDWLKNRVEQDVRKAINRAGRSGVVVRVCRFDDVFVEGIRSVYNDSPIRQGTRFRHYGKDFGTVKAENSTYLDSSEYIGAYSGEELIGFIRMVYVGNVALTLQVLSKRSQSDKKPTNALIAKAVETCAGKGVTHLVYGGYRHHGQVNSLTDFKRRNGFQEMRLPRYFVPLSVKGRVALAVGLHHGFAERIPRFVRSGIRRLRTEWRDRFYRSDAGV